MSAPGDFSPEIESPSCNKNRPRSRYRIAAWNEIAPTVYSVQRPLARGHGAHTIVGLGGFVHGQFKILKQTVNATNLKRWNESTSPSASPTVTTRKTAVEPKTTPVAVHRASRTSRRLSQVILGSDSEDETAPVAMWVASLNLTMDDKGILLRDSWLNDRHVPREGVGGTVSTWTCQQAS